MNAPLIATLLLSLSLGLYIVYTASRGLRRTRLKAGIVGTPKPASDLDYVFYDAFGKQSRSTRTSPYVGPVHDQLAS